MARRLQYAAALVLYSATALTLYDAATMAFDPGGAGAAGSWVALLAQHFLPWIASLAPAALLMVLTGSVGSQRAMTRAFWLGLGVVGSAITATVLQDFLFDGGDTAWLLANPRDVLADSVTIVLPTALLAAVYEFHIRSLDAAEAAFRVHADRIATEHEVSKARLRLLRAQIEPHFIFNSLAHVRRLYQTDTASGHKMMESLISYFAGALPTLRRETCSLAEEATLIDAYLDIHRLRMRSRLAYEVAFPTGLLALQVPSMILLTLVENAIKHGVSPLLEGGFIRVSAIASGNFLELRVADSGQGMTVNSGHGTGLANIRARLSTLYGAAATLTLLINQPRGITAAVRLPLSSVAA